MGSRVYTWSNGGRFINDVLDQFCCTLAKRENLLLRMTRGCVGVKRRMIRMMCGMRVVDRLPTDVLCDRVVVVMKIDDKIIQSRLRFFGHAICIDIDTWGYGSWNNWEKEEGQTKKIVGGVRKEGFGAIWLEERGYVLSNEMARAN